MASHAQKVAALVEKTNGSYSFDRYRTWSSVVSCLLSAGYDERQVEAIVMSKWARWAADGTIYPYGREPAHSLVEFAKKQGLSEVEKLTAEHFGE